MQQKQLRFCEEYLVDLNGSAAARRAGYDPKNAARTASRLLKLPEVREHLREAMFKRAQAADIRREDVLRELGRIAFGEASDASGAQVKIAGKLRALELLGKHLGMFEGRGGAQEGVTVIEDVPGP